MRQWASADLELKAVDPERRIVEGYASTPTVDRGHESLDPTGAEFSLPMPLLWQHQQAQPIGTVLEAEVTPAGIWIKAQIASGVAYIDEAWALIQRRLVRGFSVGFKPLVDPLRGKDGVIRFAKWAWLETSAVTIPMNPGAAILSVKAIDAYRAASGPHCSGATEPNLALRGRMTTEQITEQISKLDTTAENTKTRLFSLMDQARSEERTLSPDEATEYDTLEKALADMETDRSRLRKLETINKAAAVPVGPTPRPTVVDLRPSSISVKSMLPKGTIFTRVAMSHLYGRGDQQRTVEYAKQFKDSTPEVEMIVKAAVAVGTTTDATWAAPLVPLMQAAGAEFLELLRPATIIGRIPDSVLVHVPPNTRVPAQTGGGTYGWVGEGLSKPVTKLAFTSVTVELYKAAGIIVFTEELARLSTPRAEEVVRRDMIGGISQFLDSQFIDPAVAAVANVNPASITNGLTPLTSTNNVLADINAIFAAFTAADLDPSGAALLMSPGNAFALATTQSALGMFLYPSLGMNGGTLVGVNVITSNALGTNVIGIARDSVMIADDGGITIDASREASVQMDSAPATPPTPLVSFWQQNLVGLRAERYISWKRARAAGVQLVTGADYTPAVVAPTAARYRES